LAATSHTLAWLEGRPSNHHPVFETLRRFSSFVGGISASSACAVQSLSALLFMDIRGYNPSTIACI